MKQYHHTHELVTAVATWTSSVQNQSSQHSSLGWEVLPEFLLQLRNVGGSVASVTGKVVSFTGVSPGRLTTLQWMAQKYLDSTNWNWWVIQLKREREILGVGRYGEIWEKLRE